METKPDDRRTDEWGMVTVEYAIFLAETRGIAMATRYLATCGFEPHTIRRIMFAPKARRKAVTPST